MFSPDYVNVNQDVAVEDFKKRIQHYEEVYETVANADNPECEKEK